MRHITIRYTTIQYKCQEFKFGINLSLTRVIYNNPQVTKLLERCCGTVPVAGPQDILYRFLSSNSNAVGKYGKINCIMSCVRCGNMYDVMSRIVVCGMHLAVETHGAHSIKLTMLLRI